MTIEVLQQRGQSQSQTARILGVSEGAVRYHLRRARDGATEGRQKPSRIEQLGLAEAIAHWWQAQVQILGTQRPPSVQLLHARLHAEYGSDGSDKSVRKFVRARYGRPPVRPFRRVETPPGAQTQSDWGEFRRVDLGDSDGLTTVHAFVMILSHSRKEAVIWSRSMDQLAWHHVHNEAYRRLGGVAAVNRIDNLKTGIAAGCGVRGQINEQYRIHTRLMGFHVDAREVRAPEQKGKTERRVGDCKGLDVQGRRFDGLCGLQSWTDADRAAHAIKPVSLCRPRGGGPRLLGMRADRRSPDRRGADLVPTAHARTDHEPEKSSALPAKAATADLGTLVDSLVKLGLELAAEALPTISTRAVKEDLGISALLEQLLRSELERRVRTSPRLSGLPTGQTLANFDVAFQPAVLHSKLEALATCAWRREKQGLLILGPPGVGKTH